MNFTQIGLNRVESDEGFVVWMRNPFQIHYFEGGRELIVPGEMMTGEAELLVSVSSVRSWNHPVDAIDAPTRDRIAGNIAEALRFMKIRFEFD